MLIYITEKSFFTRLYKRERLWYRPEEWTLIIIILTGCKYKLACDNGYSNCTPNKQWPSIFYSQKNCFEPIDHLLQRCSIMVSPNIILVRPALFSNIRNWTDLFNNSKSSFFGDQMTHTILSVHILRSPLFLCLEYKYA